MEGKWPASRLGGGTKAIIPIIKDTRQRHWNPTTASAGAPQEGESKQKHVPEIFYGRQSRLNSGLECRNKIRPTERLTKMTAK